MLACTVFVYKVKNDDDGNIYHTIYVYHRTYSILMYIIIKYKIVKMKTPKPEN